VIESDFIGFPAKNPALHENSKKLTWDQQNLFIESDEKRIKQVLINLQSNALKFTKEGGKIRILCEFIKGVHDEKSMYKRHKGVVEKLFKDSYSSGKHSSGSESNHSEVSKFDR
jgi:signal transduction histidine kinase